MSKRALLREAGVLDPVFAKRVRERLLKPHIAGATLLAGGLLVGGVGALYIFTDYSPEPGSRCRAGYEDGLSNGEPHCYPNFGIGIALWSVGGAMALSSIAPWAIYGKRRKALLQDARGILLEAPTDLREASRRSLSLFPLTGNNVLGLGLSGRM